MTTNQHEDIRNDLNHLQTLTNSKAETAMNFQDRMMKAVQAVVHHNETADRAYEHYLSEKQ